MGVFERMRENADSRSCLARWDARRLANGSQEGLERLISFAWRETGAESEETQERKKRREGKREKKAFEATAHVTDSMCTFR